MKHYVGLDVSLKEVSICVVDADGAVIAEGKVATEPPEILSWIEGRVGAVERIVHESGPQAWRRRRDFVSRHPLRLGQGVSGRSCHPIPSLRCRASGPSRS